MFDALRAILGLAPGVATAVGKAAQELTHAAGPASGALPKGTVFPEAGFKALPLAEKLAPIAPMLKAAMIPVAGGNAGRGNLPVVAGQEGPWNPNYALANGGSIPMPKVGGQNGPWSLDYLGLNTPGMTRPGADFNGIQPSTSFDGGLQGYNQNDLSTGIQGGQVNQGFIPLQSSGFGVGGAANLQPAATLSTILKRK